MYFWDKIKQLIRRMAEKDAQTDVIHFMLGKPYGTETPSCLKKLDERVAYKQNLTVTYTYQEGDDLLAKKQDFIDQYTINEREQFQYFIINNLFDRDNKIKTMAWRNHEQVERGEAQKAWRQLRKRNYHAHMRQKFINQKTR